MRRLVTASEMRKIEKFAMDELKLSDLVLMERASYATASYIADYLNKHNKYKVLVVYGNGNNGADGIATARILVEKGFQVTICPVVLNKRQSQLNERQLAGFRRITELDENAFECNSPWDRDVTKVDLPEYDVIVDAILGIGVNRELSDDLIKIIEWMNCQTGYKVSIDIPTGIETDSGNMLKAAFCADLTVTFGSAKTGLYLNAGKVKSGQIIVDSCAMKYSDDESQFFCLEENDISKALIRDRQGNKGTFGKIGILSGSEKICGAAVLSTMAAFRSGAGYICLYTHENNKQTIMDKMPETVLSLYNSQGIDDSEFKAFCNFARVFAVGPGLGIDDISIDIVDHLISYLETTEIKKPVVMDADAINILADHEDYFNRLMKCGSTITLTPHLMEFSRLIHKPVSEIKLNRVFLAKEFCKETGMILVLKDSETIIASKEEAICINVTGNDGMAVAGSGDVLCGILVSLIGQGLRPFDAACIGVYLHGMAGDVAAAQLGRHAMVPTDLIDRIGSIIHSFE